MSKERVERRLAAIMAADVVGYSRLMGADEEDTLASLRTLRRELIHPKFEQHKGRIVKTTGDGMLVEFASVVDAVRCAVEMQREMVVRNFGVPNDQRMEIRVGINLGDIIVTNRAEERRWLRRAYDTPEQLDLNRLGSWASRSPASCEVRENGV